MSWQNVRIGEKIPDVFVMNLDFADFSKLARLSPPGLFEKKINKLQNQIEKLFRKDIRYRLKWAGDGLVVLYRAETDMGDDLVLKATGIIDLIRLANKKKDFSDPIRLRIGLNVGNIIRVFPVSLRAKVRGKKLTSVSRLINQRRTTDVAENTAHPERSSAAI